MIICAAIHGILTGQTSASWPDQLDAWMSRNDPRVEVIKKEYSAGPFPRLNWFKNRRLARSLANEIQLFIDPKDPAPGSTDHVWLVAHSNGAVIALETLRRLNAAGVRVRGVFLTGAACGSDVDENGIAAAMEAGLLDRAVSRSSPDDGVVNCSGFWKFLKWPYGDLGRKGWQRFDAARSAIAPYQTWKCYTLWARGGHTVYFAPGKIEETFQMIKGTIEGAEMETRGQQRRDAAIAPYLEGAR